MRDEMEKKCRMAASKPHNQRNEKKTAENCDSLNLKTAKATNMKRASGKPTSELPCEGHARTLF